MKKYMWLFGVILGFALLLSGCEQLAEPLDDGSEIEDYVLGKKGGNKSKTSILDLTVGGTQLIKNDEVVFPYSSNPRSHPIIVLDGDTPIHYHITSTTTDIYFVRLELRYDANANSELYNHADGDDYILESGSQIFQDMYYGDSDFELNETFSWNGYVQPFGLDAQVYNYGRYKLFDELATYDYQSDQGFESPWNQCDHYLMRIDVYAEGSTKLASKTVYLWFAGTQDRSLQKWYVNSVEIYDFTVNKNKVTPHVKVQVYKNGSPAQGAFVQGRWGGLLEGSDSFMKDRGQADVNGWVYIDGPEFRKNQSGPITFTVGTIRDRYGVYNPWENTTWDWPVLPFDEEVW